MRTSRVLYRNTQWAVTNYGIESLEDPWYYPIEKSRLDERADYLGPTVSDWIVHVCAKTWVDGSLFVDAFRKALVIHNTADPPDVDLSERIARRENWLDEREARYHRPPFDRTLPKYKKRRHGEKAELVIIRGSDWMKEHTP